MTQVLDRMLGIAARADAAAGCLPDPYTDTWVRCQTNGTYLDTCRRSCSTSGDCTTHCSAYSCVCERFHQSCGHHYS
jgi:hypothetical protein